MKKLVFAVLLLLSITSCDTSSSSEFEPPNILFIEVDDLTAKYLGFNGSRFAKTPNIDSLAYTGVYFKNTMAQGVMCTPSRNSLITGKYPHELGLYENLDLKSLPKGIWAFPMALQDQGYTNFWVGKNHLLPYNRGLGAKNVIDMKNKAMQLNMGFDSVYQSYGRSMLIDLARKQSVDPEAWPRGRDPYFDYLEDQGLLETFAKEGGSENTTLDPNTEFMDGHFTTFAMEKLREYKEDSPFFMWLNYSGPHAPFNVPKEYYEKFYRSQMPAVIPAECENFPIPKALKTYTNVKYDSMMTAGYRKRYMASIAYIDDQVGRILDFIKSSRFKDNTAIVFFSDHGIMTGDHGLVGKNTLFKEVLDAGLIINYPKEFTPNVIETPVELLDLGKTALDMANLNDSTLNSIKIGNSLLPLLTDHGRFTGNGLAFSEMRDFKSVFDGEYKYIYNAETPILFNLKENPDETENWIDREPKKAAELKKAIEVWLDR